ncbi:hypothetical protein PGT21_015830 [Puccinia graminis f. sp. tritici]|uniref:Uncharacterized protein n=1 Tax=Puccinia graminis f. sp. tritici TaxID=56615 RepID=A0A5B0QAJ3_PUCGR|nr:hypothetical protein PGT21_015830 [Puccinia graminis f. sp. tritici]
MLIIPNPSVKTESASTFKTEPFKTEHSERNRSKGIGSFKTTVQKDLACLKRTFQKDSSRSKRTVQKDSARLSSARSKKASVKTKHRQVLVLLDKTSVKHRLQPCWPTTLILISFLLLLHFTPHLLIHNIVPDFIRNVVVLVDAVSL